MSLKNELEDSLSLDFRTAQNLVDEAKKRIPYYIEEWTDHNVSDPGVAFIELFAYMSEQVLYMLNQFPKKHYELFMKMLGIQPEEARPAHAKVTFWLSEPLDDPVQIPTGIEVATTQTETENSIIFTTDKQITIVPPELATIVREVDDNYQDLGRTLTSDFAALTPASRGSDKPSGVPVFVSEDGEDGAPQTDNALYFGFYNDLSHHTLRFNFTCDPKGAVGINPSSPPWIWEIYSANGRWAECEIDKDTTGGMRFNGYTSVHLGNMEKQRLGNIGRDELYWVRVRVRRLHSDEIRDGIRGYTRSPYLHQLKVASWGGSVPVTQAQIIYNQFLGVSDGEPGQQFRLLDLIRLEDEHKSILDRMSHETLIVQEAEDGPKVAWEEKPDFADSGANDQHYTLDSSTGTLRFGVAVRQPNGTLRQYGAIPPKGAQLWFSQYRYGGGVSGNVQARQLNTLKTAIPYINKVTNLKAAKGGLDTQSIDDMIINAPKLLRAKERAVTEEDFVFLTEREFGHIAGRVMCLQTRPSEATQEQTGTVFILVIPRMNDEYAYGYLSPDQLSIADVHLNQIEAFLDSRRMLTTWLKIKPPTYHWVRVKVYVQRNPEVDADLVEQAIQTKLYQYINPLVGGVDGDGWPLGRDVYESDIYQCLQNVPGLRFIERVELYEVSHPEANPQGDPLRRLNITTQGVVASAIRHDVSFLN